jgi:putative CocE/NonD family hydrolase
MRRFAPHNLAVSLAAAAGCGAAPERAIPPSLVLADVAAPGPPPVVAPRGYGVVVDRDVAVAMRDGTKLFADVYRPDAAGRFPVILARTPYDRRQEADLGLEGAKRGYVVVLEDVRGRYASQGEWYPFRHESEDGYDTVEWAAALPASSGQVGMVGPSYVGATQMLAAVAHPPHLSAIAPDVTASDYHEGWTYQGGAFEQGFAETWTSFLARDTEDRRRKDTNARAWERKLPLATFPVLEASPPGAGPRLAPYFRDWLAHPTDDAYWRALSIEPRYDAIRVPALHISGWYDIFLLGTLRNFVGMKAHGGQRLVIGPHDHMWSKGEVDFGPAANRPVDEFRWFDTVLKGAPDAGEKPVQLFVMGKNEWRGEDDWPLARAKVTRYSLHAGGGLSTASPANEPPDSFVYDPADPAPTVGGGTCCDSEHFPGGAFDQRRVEARKDVRVFRTGPMEHDVEVTGPVSVELFVSSSARDTDFTAKLVDVWPNGFAQNLTDGIVRMRFRDSREKAAFLEPGKVYRVSIDLAGTSNVFLAGHRMAVEISSSNFPRFDRNLNTVESPEQGTVWRRATNTVLHDAAHPSALIVSLVPG